ncbi:hypothetical protein GALL_87770 [mine drainage metagenome]|uniref:DUF1007 family protein n=1 Tax=mine drainage metagenome TaxID=410659 RepID=A0A1J5SL21_9ZZZZ
MRRAVLLIVAAVALPPLGAAPALAHPHVWVDTIVTAELRNGRIAALQEDWSFDEDFTASVLDDLHGNKGMMETGPHGPTFSAAELAQLKKSAFSNLKHYDYFTHIWQNGKATKVAPEVSAFAARMDGDKLRYLFTVALAKPLDPKDGPIRIGIWDDTYYVDVGPVKGRGAAVSGPGSASCRARIIVDKSHPIYFGSVFPQTAEITC